MRTVTILYRREQDGQQARNETGPLAAASQLEQELAAAGFDVRQRDARAYEELERGPQVILEFDADGGAAIVFSQTQVVQPHSRSSDWQQVEVRLRARALLGPLVLVAGNEASGRGQSTATVSSPEGVAAAVEKAAAQAATELAGKLSLRLAALTAADIAARLRPIPSVVVGGQVVPVVQIESNRPTTTQPPPTAAPASLAPPKRRYALLVGVSDYSRVNRTNAGRLTMSNLAGVAADMKNLSAFLKTRGFASEDIVVLENERATSVNVRGQLMTLAGKGGADDLVFVAISAHGAPGQYTPSGYGVPVLDDFRYDGKTDLNATDFWQIQG